MRDNMFSNYNWLWSSIGNIVTAAGEMLIFKFVFAVLLLLFFMTIKVLGSAGKKM